MITAQDIQAMGLHELQSLCRQLLEDRPRGPCAAPHPLFDEVMKRGGFRSSGQMATELGFDANAISTIRAKRRAVPANLILAIHEKVGMPFAEIRALIAKA